MNEIEEISKNNDEIQKKNHESFDDFDFLKSFDNKLPKETSSSNNNIVSKEKFVEKQIVSPYVTPLKPQNSNDDIIDQKDFFFPDLNFIGKNTGNILNLVESTGKKSTNPFEDIVETISNKDLRNTAEKNGKAFDFIDELFQKPKENNNLFQSFSGSNFQQNKHNIDLL